jgi:hypothetical protein
MLNVKGMLNLVVLYLVSVPGSINAALNVHFGDFKDVWIRRRGMDVHMFCAHRTQHDCLLRCLTT